MQLPSRIAMTDWIVVHARLLIVAVVVLSVLLVCWADHRDREPVISTPVKKEVDSLVATAPLVDAVVTHFKQDDSVVAERIAQRAPVIHLATAEAARLGATADSLAALAQSRADSAALWHKAYLARTHEADSLLSANRGLAQDTIALNKRLAIKDSIIFVEHQRRVKLDSVMADVSRELAEKSKGCKLIGPVPCPTRAEALGLGALGTLILRR